MKILLTGVDATWVREALEKAGHEVVFAAADAYVNEDAFCEAISSFDAYVSGGLEKATRRVFEKAENLKLIVFLGVDYKAYIDAEAAAEKGVKIVNTPGANAQAVAELTLFLMLALARKAGKVWADMQQKRWASQMGTEIQAKTLGLVGSGPIARAVSHMAVGLGVKVIYWSRSGPQKDMQGVYQSWKDVVAESDILSLHVPKAAGTLLNAEAIACMKPQSMLINTAPASLVDADALYSALKSGHLTAAAFDPFYTEGEGAWTCAESPLLTLSPETFMLTPHMGWKTQEADARMLQMAIEAICRA